LRTFQNQSKLKQELIAQKQKDYFAQILTRFSAANKNKNKGIYSLKLESAQRYLSLNRKAADGWKGHSTC
jgi:hypothetical protein